MLDISPVFFLSLEQENKTVFFVDSCKTSKRLGKSLLEALLTVFTEGGLEEGELAAGARSAFGEGWQGLGGDNRKQELTVSLPGANTYRLNLQLNFCP